MGTESSLAYIVLTPLVGALVTVMNGVNSRFSSSVGNLVSTLVIHIAGLAAVSVFLAARREKKRPGKIPAYYYLGGFVGVGTVFSCNYTFAALGASLAVTLALLGQTLFSLAVDASGFLGRKKYPLGARSLPGIALAIAGVAVMTGDWRSNAVAMLVALVSGALPGLSFILNSELGRRKGIVRSTRINYLVGLGTTLLIVAAVRPPAAEALRAVAAAGPFLALGGGLMGVAIVAATNLIFPRIPAFSATLLLFSGQAFAGLAIDFLAAGAFDARKLLGALLLLAGLAINALLGRRPDRERVSIEADGADS
jgi:bacterial/archaeal transporter family-2 protein